MSSSSDKKKLPISHPDSSLRQKGESWNSKNDSFYPICQCVYLASKNFETVNSNNEN